MSTSILIISSLLLIIIIISSYIYKNGLFKKFKDKKQPIYFFMTSVEIVDMITEDALLTEEEKESLELLMPLSHGYKLQNVFDNVEILERWFTDMRRIVYHSKEWDPDLKKNIEYNIYEIFRKIHNTISLKNPSIKKSLDITIGQYLEIRIPNVIIFNGKVIENNIQYMSISTNNKNVEKLKINHHKEKIHVDFWKALDAGYHFETTIENISFPRNGIYIIRIKSSKKIACTKIRYYPRRDSEIAAKIKQESSTDKQSIMPQDAVTLGIINNISPNGCSIISDIDIEKNRYIMIEFPLFDQIINVKGIIRNTKFHGSVYSLHIEFTEDIPKSTILLIYHFIFAKKNISKEDIKLKED